MPKSKIRKELEDMIALFNETEFGGADRQSELKLKLKVAPRPDLGGVIVFLVVCQKKEVFVAGGTVVMPIPPITICWGGGKDTDAACEIVLKKFEKGSDLIGKYLPFTAGSLEELKLKLAVYE